MNAPYLPAYAARDMLDFERRPRSNTVETSNMTEVSKSTQAASGSGRHPGIQPSMHADPAPKEQKPPETGGDPSHLTSSSNTFVNEQEGRNRSDRAVQETSQSYLSTERPSLPVRSASGDPSRWLSFTLPVKYRKRLDDYMAGRAPAHEPEPAVRASSSSDSEHESSADEWHRQYFGRNRREHPDASRQNSGEHGDDSEIEGEYREQRPRKQKRKKESKTQQAHEEIGGASGGGGEEGLAMTMRANVPDGLPISTNMADTPGWNSPWAPHQPRTGDGPGPVGINRFDTMYSHGDSVNGTQKKKQKTKTRIEHFQRWLVRSAFAPLFFRVLNLAFTASILGIAVVR